MLAMLSDLVQHKIYADTLLLNAIRAHPAAAQDAELRTTLHHIVVSNRYWLFLALNRPFARAEESMPPASLEALAARYAETHALEREWLSRVVESDLSAELTTPHLPAARYTVAQAMTQVCLHSQGHRAQCATRLRALGGTPPTLDFILWVGENRVAGAP